MKACLKRSSKICKITYILYLNNLKFNAQSTNFEIENLKL